MIPSVFVREINHCHRLSRWQELKLFHFAEIYV